MAFPSGVHCSAPRPPRKPVFAMANVLTGSPPWNGMIISRTTQTPTARSEAMYRRTFQSASLRAPHERLPARTSASVRGRIADWKVRGTSRSHERVRTRQNRKSAVRSITSIAVETKRTSCFTLFEPDSSDNGAVVWTDAIVGIGITMPPTDQAWKRRYRCDVETPDFVA